MVYILNDTEEVFHSEKEIKSYLENNIKAEILFDFLVRLTEDFSVVNKSNFSKEFQKLWNNFKSPLKNYLIQNAIEEMLKDNVDIITDEEWKEENNA